MVDIEKNNEEYEFVESELEEPKSFEESSIEGAEESYVNHNAFKMPDVWRNVVLAAGFIIGVLLLYALFFSRPKPKITAPSQPSIPAITQASPISPAPETAEMKQKIASIESTQQSLSSQINSFNQQLSTVNNSVNSINEQINKLNNIVTSLSNQVEKQSEELRILVLHPKPAPIPVRVLPIRPPIIYFIKAIIPGRAWLIAPNGSTLSVREGITLEGYGLIKLIDSIQGRIITSSGRVIRFSPEDS